MPALANDSIPRTDPCWCRSGRAFSQCHGDSGSTPVVDDVFVPPLLELLPDLPPSEPVPVPERSRRSVREFLTDENTWYAAVAGLLAWSVGYAIAIYGPRAWSFVEHVSMPSRDALAAWAQILDFPVGVAALVVGILALWRTRERDSGEPHAAPDADVVTLRPPPGA